ncbi:MAG: hypothetical protein CL868_05205 [Cytophagaceae bacterium]|nr:hypothetical protein [Cytophagaceae bacterium]|tara:strand:- start:11400 stop:11636 length:237 start_codon:yes stop_codon:yes gene_type:complete
MDEYIKVLTSSTIIINRVAQLLQENNIPTHIKDHVESGRLAGFSVQQNDIELHIPQAEYAHAHQILAAAELDIKISEE